MIVIGDQLRAAREKKSLSLEQVCADTNIAKRYLSALEDDNFTIFPGDPYIVGFLRNYADYLGLESASLIAAFKNMRIQEQPVPVAQLIPTQKKPGLAMVITVLAVAALVGIVMAVTSLKLDGKKPPSTTERPNKPTEYAFGASPFERRFYPGDSLLVTYASEKYQISLAGIGERLAIESPSGKGLYMLGEEGSIDLDKDNSPEILVFIGDFDKNEPSKGALIRFSKTGKLAENGTIIAEADGLIPPAVDIPATDVPPVTVPVAELPTETGKGTVLFADNKGPFPFMLSATFRSYCMFRYEVDRKERDERYYQKSDQLTVNANNTMKIWVSNATAGKLSVQASGGKNAELELGQPGEVVVKSIKWVKADNGSWSLMIFDVN